MNKLMPVLACCFISFSATASDLEDLAKVGYAVIDETTIEDYDFEGCDYDQVIKFNNGLKFQCSEYNYHYSYNPEVFILKHARYSDYKVIIDNKEFEGSLGR